MQTQAASFGTWIGGRGILEDAMEVGNLGRIPTLSGLAKRGVGEGSLHGRHTTRIPICGVWIGSGGVGKC